MLFAWQAQGFRHVAKYVAGAGAWEGCKNVGMVDLKRVRNDAIRLVAAGISWLSCRCLKARTLNPWKVANFMSRKCYFAGIISRGSYRSSYASAQLFRGRRSTFEAST